MRRMTRSYRQGRGMCRATLTCCTNCVRSSSKATPSHSWLFDSMAFVTVTVINRKPWSHGVHRPSRSVTKVGAARVSSTSHSRP